MHCVYSCIVTDLEATTSFLQEVAGMHVRSHQDYFQSLGASYVCRISESTTPIDNRPVSDPRFDVKFWNF